MSTWILMKRRIAIRFVETKKANEILYTTALLLTYFCNKYAQINIDEESSHSYIYNESDMFEFDASSDGSDGGVSF